MPIVRRRRGCESGRDIGGSGYTNSIGTGVRKDEDVGHVDRPCMPVAQGQNPCYGKEMSRITSKLQVTVPKRIADQFGLVPGAEVTFTPAGGVIVLHPSRARADGLTREERLALFDAATLRLHTKVAPLSAPAGPTDRGWTREDLYDRAGPR